jgi:type II secretory pathway pseudopilin PulG
MTLKYRRDGRRAFTLIELLIIVAILGITTASMTTMFVALKRHGRKVVNTQRAHSILQSEKEWLVAGAAAPADGKAYTLPLDPQVLAPVPPSATGHYRITTTGVPGLNRLTLVLQWEEANISRSESQEHLFTRREGGP